jgi:glycerol uptake facilitator-like aquaporin
MIQKVTEWLYDVRPRVASKCVHEFLGCMMFHFIGSVSPTPGANAIALMVLVYYTAKTSGGHLNPALTLSFTLLGHTNPFEMIFYWMAQISGCAVGALWLALLVPGLSVRKVIERAPGVGAHDGCFLPRNDLSNANVFGWEAFMTFCFLVPIFSVVWYTTHKKGYGNTGPIMIGLSLFASAFAAGPYTGAALNPARALASPIVFDCGNREKIFYYLMGELVGAVCTPLAIMPWYGVARKAWYMPWVPVCIKRRMKYHQPSLVVRGIHDVQSQQPTLPIATTILDSANETDIHVAVDVATR